MTRQQVYLEDDDKAICVKNLKGETLFQFTYKDDRGNLLWNRESSWRTLRREHLNQNYMTEVFKCACGKINELPQNIRAEYGEDGRITTRIDCVCGKETLITCDVLSVKGE